MRTILVTASALLLSTPVQADDWAFFVEPYLMVTSIEGDAGVGRATGAEVDVDFSTILDNLDIGAMIRFEGKNTNGWGFILDYAFMDLSDDVVGSRGGVVDARIRQGILEALLTRETGRSGLEIFAGFRWWDNDIDVAIDPAILPGSVVTKTDASWIDLVVGTRLTRALNERWTFRGRADIGGFGVESDFTAQIAAGASYDFNERYALDLQYKAVWVDFEEGRSGQPGAFSYDTVTHGPIVGLMIRF